MLDPRYGTIHLDANALEPPHPEDKPFVSQFFDLVDTHALSVINPYGVQQEIDHPRTPASIRLDRRGISTIPTELTSNEKLIHSKLAVLLRGDAAPGKHAADASHIFESQKYGGRYFVTHDQRLLKRRDEIAGIIGSGFNIVTLREFLVICVDCGLR